MIWPDRSVWRIAEPVFRAISVHGAESRSPDRSPEWSGGAKRRSGTEASGPDCGSERSGPKSLGKLAEQFGTHGDRSQIMEEEAQSIQIGAE